MSVAADIAAYLESLGYGFGHSVGINFMAEQPDNIIAVYQTGGRAAEKAMGNKQLATRFPTVQVDIRHTDAATAESTADAIHDALDGLIDAPSGYSLLIAMQDPIRLAQDDNERTVFVFNLECRKV